MLRLISCSPDIKLLCTFHPSPEHTYCVHDSSYSVKVQLTPCLPCSYLILPENSLHPKNQQELVWTEIANSHKDHKHLSIFTYSEHILNAVRLAVVREVISHKEVEIHYYTLEGLRVPKIYKCGGIDLWPEGFFDQIDISLEELLTVRSTQR